MSARDSTKATPAEGRHATRTGAAEPQAHGGQRPPFKRRALHRLGAAVLEAMRRVPLTAGKRKNGRVQPNTNQLEPLAALQAAVRNATKQDVVKVALVSAGVAAAIYMLLRANKSK
jgi:hypothetical protein